MTLRVDRAHVADVEHIAPLFDAYRRFYGRAGDIGLARAFIRERLEGAESTIFLARVDGRAVGFTQLYPSFTSAGAARIFILNDLYVAPEAEGRGAGTALLKAAEAFARSEGASSLRLSTNVDNGRAQALYRRSGWARNDAFVLYELPLEPSSGQASL